MEYNTSREQMIIPEYGRSIQQMVEIAVALPSKEERTKAAKTIVNAMAILNPTLRDMSDFKHKLWDHLFIISGLRLDCESPFPAPDRDTIHVRPKPLKYPQKSISKRHYGSIIQNMIREARALPESTDRSQVTEQIANFMKVAYLTWNRDNVSDELIRDQLREFSEGELVLPEELRLTGRSIEIVDHSRKNNKNRPGKKRNGFNRGK